jgi:signal transduction histidine kinase
MQQTRQVAVLGVAERKRVEAVVETLTTRQSAGENLTEVAHDARNMVTALGLYCDLLEEPGVLAVPFAHYGSELRLVAVASRRLVEKLVALDTERDREAAVMRAGLRAPIGEPSRAPNREPGRETGRRPGRAEPAERSGAAGLAIPARHWDLLPSVLIDNLAGELLANRNLLAALAGPTIALTVDTEAGALPVRLTGEDLTRVLVNLVKNAAEAMPAGGRVLLSLRERPAVSDDPQGLMLTIDDNGLGIPAGALDSIFEAGFSTQPASSATGGWPAAHRGLGLSITRSIIESAGGHIRAVNRSPAGARLEIELPVRKH